MRRKILTVIAILGMIVLSPIAAPFILLWLLWEAAEQVVEELFPK